MIDRLRGRVTWDPQFGEHLHSIWRIRRPVLIGSILIAAGVLAWRMSVPERYEAVSGLRLVIQTDGRPVLDEDRLELASRIYAELAETRPLVRRAVDRSGTGYAPDSTVWELTVDRASPPGFLEITASAPSAGGAVALTEAMAEALIETVDADTDSPGNSGDGGSTVVVLELVEPARLPTESVAPRPFREAGVALIAAMVVLAELGALMRMLSGRLPSVRTAERLEQMTGVSTVELSGDLDDGAKLSLFAGRHLKANKLVTVTQCGGWPNPAAAVLLAEAMARTDRRVLIIDADPKRPTLDIQLGIDREPGLADVLGGRSPLMEAVHQLEDKESVSVLSVGSQGDHGRWSTADLTRFLASTRAALRFDVIVMSLSSASMPSGVASVLEVELDNAMVLTFDPEATTRRQVNELIHTFGGPDSVAGLVLMTGRRATTELGWLARRWATTPGIEVSALEPDS